jgi:hypothetical protein
MDYVSLFLSVLFALGAAVCLGFSMYFFYHDKHKRGIAFSTLMFVCALLAYVPQLDSIKSGFVDAKFNRTLNQANDIIARLTAMAQLNSKVAYTVLAWGGRLGGPYARDKQIILDEIGQQLADLKISDNERHDISKKFIELVAVDLGGAYARCLSLLVDDKVRRAEQATSQEAQKDANSPAKTQLDDLTKKVSAWQKQMQVENGVAVERYDLSTSMKLATPDAILSASEREAANRFQDKIIALYKASAAKGNLTTDTAGFIDSFQTEDGVKDRTSKEFGYSFDSQDK